MLTRTTLLLICGALAACTQQGDEAPAPAQDQAASPPESAAAQPAPRLTRKPSPEGATAYIISPADGAVVTSPVQVVFGLKGAGVAPAGVDKPGTGHHHLLVDADIPPLDAPIPSDDHHRHFGGGQTETMLTLSPGEHRLQLILGDDLHIPHDPPIISAPVTIQVQP